MRISVEPAKALSARQECDVMRAAVARNPASASLRLRLARLLNQLDAFDEAIAVLTAPTATAPDFEAAMALARACFARDAEGDLARADAAIRLAGSLAATAAERSAVLAEEAKVLLRLDRGPAARAQLAAALACDPGNTDACRRLAVDMLRAGEGEAVLALTDRLMAQGVGHARLFAVRALAHAQAGRIDAARAAIDPDGLRHAGILPVPAGWDSLAAFNVALADELAVHPGMRYERHGTASQKTWRIDALATGAAPLARALLAGIVAVAERHIAALPEPAPHPRGVARPAAGVLHSWCVITKGDGFETWHAHPYGWMSGVYYVQVPDAVMHGEGPGGCIGFGLPDGLIGAEAAQAFGETLVRPVPGLLMLFPSQAYHRTFPHGAAERRICVSFDIWPA